MQQVAARDSQLQVLGRNIADRLQVIKGLPMTCLVLSHDGAPPDEITGYHSATLAPLHCYWVRGYSAHVAPNHRRLADGHQVFQAWKAGWEWPGWRRQAPGSRPEGTGRCGGGGCTCAIVKTSSSGIFLPSGIDFKFQRSGEPPCISAFPGSSASYEAVNKWTPSGCDSPNL